MLLPCAGAYLKIHWGHGDTFSQNTGAGRKPKIDFPGFP